MIRYIVLSVVFVFVSFFLPASIDAQEKIYFPVIFGKDSQKRGVHIALGNTTGDIDILGGTWFKTNGPRTGYQNSEFVPSLSTVDRLVDIGVAVDHSDGWITGFNEPATPSRYISPKDAAGYWFYIQTVTELEGIKLTSPAIAPGNMWWLWEMVRQYKIMFGVNPHFDAVNIHVYDNSVSSAQSYIVDVRQQMISHGYGTAELWITEMGSYCPDTTPAQTSYVMSEMVQWLDATEYVQRYAWFTNRVPEDSNWSNYSPCALVDNDTGELLPLGVQYAGY